MHRIMDGARIRGALLKNYPIWKSTKSLKKKISESKLPIRIIHLKHRKLRKNPALFAH